MSPKSTNPYYLEVRSYKSKTKLVLRVLDNALYTSELPATKKTLKRNLPSILAAKCYNGQNLPFHKEVENTELGHLYEHILLEYLCDGKMQLGGKRATFSGFTDWNWKRDLRGTFHITLNIQNHDAHLLEVALERTNLLFLALLGQRALPL